MAEWPIGGVIVVHSFVSDPDQVKLIETWRLRHAYPDAIGIWAASSGLEARAFAFNAIAQDPRVLRRAERLHAIRMATQAEDFAASLAQTGIAKSETWIAVALYVQRSIDKWRSSFRAYDRHGESMGTSVGAAIARAQLSDPWEIAQRNFPHVEDDTGMLATRILRECGETVLKRARKPWDHVIVLAVLRYAARLLRGERVPTAPGFTADRAIADILTVQSYTEESGLSPMAVGYSGPGRPALQALELLRDAHTLRDACTRRGRGWRNSRGGLATSDRLSCLWRGGAGPRDAVAAVDGRGVRDRRRGRAAGRNGAPGATVG